MRSDFVVGFDLDMTLIDSRQGVGEVYRMLAGETTTHEASAAACRLLGLQPTPRRKSGKPLPHVSELSHEEQLKLEDQNVVACLKYARESLGM